MTKPYNSITNNNNGLPWPYTRAINASGATEVDGTEVFKSVIDDIWMRNQSFLSFYNFDPNNVEDAPGVSTDGAPLSQPLLAQYFNYAPPGVIVPWMGSKDPAEVSGLTGCNIRVLLLAGQGIDRTLDEYKALDFVCYIGNDNNNIAEAFYHANSGDGSGRNVNGQYLILPDMRGYALRGMNFDAGGVDPDGPRLPGSSQEDMFQAFQVGTMRQKDGKLYLATIRDYGSRIQGTGDDDAVRPSYHLFNKTITNRPEEGAHIAQGSPERVTAYSDGSNGDPRTGPETRMKNVAVKFGIYY